jgi:hypothetical protein
MDDKVYRQLERVAEHLERLVVGSDKAIKTDVVQLPDHFYPPKESISVDIRSLAVIAAGTSFELLKYVADSGAKTFFYGYALFNDALLFADVEFVVKLDGTRILQKHGTPIYSANNPNARYKLALGVGPDISNSSIIPCQVAMNPGQTLTWTAVNAAAVDVVMGVRMTGYQSQETARKTGRISS